MSVAPLHSSPRVILVSPNPLRLLSMEAALELSRPARVTSDVGSVALLAFDSIAEHNV